MSEQTDDSAADKRAALAQRPDKLAVASKSQEAAKSKAPKPKKTAVQSAGSAALALSPIIAELEERLVQSELNTNKALHARIRRLETDVATYREAREAAEFKVVDLRAALDDSAARIESLRAAPAHRLGSLLISAAGDWRELVRLPASLMAWARETRQYQEDVEARIVPEGTAAEYNAAVERALEVADKRGLDEAGRWAVDQRFKGPVLARVLAELANLARKSDPDQAVRFAEDALEADPGENRIKRLAFLMTEAGSIGPAARLLRAAISKGAALNATEAVRADELFALAELASSGLVLTRKRKWIRPAGQVNQRVLIFSPQAYPYHWSSVSIRTHALASSLTKAGGVVDVATAPGYPDLGSREHKERPPTRQVDGVDYHLLPHAKARPGLGDDYVRQTASMLVALIRRFGATTLIAPFEVVHGYPAAIAAQIAGISLVLDGWSVTPPADECRTELSRIMASLEEQLLDKAQLTLARTPAIAARLGQVSQAAKIVLAADITSETPSAEPPEKRSGQGSFVFGYVGDNTPDVDLEGLAEVLQGLVAEGVDARLVIYAVGARVKALGDRLDLAGLGNRVEIVEKSPAGRRIDLAYRDMDVVVVPMLPAPDILKSPFQILASVRHGKCVVAVGAEEHRELFGAAILHAGDLAAATRTLAELAGDLGLRRRQEAEARAWDRDHPGEPALLDAVRSL
jgi:glycosyltransferase involved in cell wall biosynthesis